jgi:hypothetical protein
MPLRHGATPGKRSFIPAGKSAWWNCPKGFAAGITGVFYAEPNPPGRLLRGHAVPSIRGRRFHPFAARLTAPTDCLADTAQAMPVPGARACMRVTVPERPILFVASQGYSYARYVARLA